MNGYGQAEGGQNASPQPVQPQAQPVAEGEGNEPAFAAAATSEGGEFQGQSGSAGEGGEGPRRHRDRRPRRRNRNGEGGQLNVDPANAPQPDVGELPAFLTAGTTPTVAE
jgi:hypothetical protein